MQHNNSDSANNISKILDEIVNAPSIYKTKAKSPKKTEVRTDKSSGLYEGHRKRLDQKIEEYGFESLNEYEQLEYILFVARRRINTNDIAHRLISEFGTLNGVLNASVKELEKVKGVGYRTACFLTQLNDVSGMILRNFEKENIKFDDAQRMAKYIQTFYIGKKNEAFHMFLLDLDKRLIKVEKISEGNHLKTEVYNHQIIKAATTHNASYVVIAHNHPSGNENPSESDIASTQYIRDILKALDIVLMDSIIISKGKYYSFKENQYLNTINWMPK